jgi:hypothetical protein
MTCPDPTWLDLTAACLATFALTVLMMGCILTGDR